MVMRPFDEIVVYLLFGAKTNEKNLQLKKVHDLCNKTKKVDGPIKVGQEPFCREFIAMPFGDFPA